MATGIRQETTIRCFEQHEDTGGMAAHVESDHVAELDAVLPDLLVSGLKEQAVRG